MFLRCGAFVTGIVIAGAVAFQPLAHARSTPEVTTVLSPPTIEAVVSQELRYDFAPRDKTFPRPWKPAIVFVTLRLGGVPAAGSYVGCGLTNAIPTYSDTLASGTTTGIALEPDSSYWCFATALPIYSPNPADWSSGFLVETRSTGVLTLELSDEAWVTFGSPDWGPWCSWCRVESTKSWRWPMVDGWKLGRTLRLPGGFVTSGLGLEWTTRDARLTATADGSLGFEVDFGGGWWTQLAFTRDLQTTEAGFVADLHLTEDETLLAPFRNLPAGMFIGRLTLTQDRVIDPPSAPSDISAAVKPGKRGTYRVTISWSPPTEDGGQAVTEYRYKIRLGKKFSPWQVTGSTRFSLTVPSNRGGKVVLAAGNSAGYGPAASISFKPPK